MTRLAYVDVIGGAAGDMLLAALIDAGAPLESVQASIDAVLDDRYRIRTDAVRRGGYAALLLGVDPEPEPADARSFADLRARLDRASLPGTVRDRAWAILDRLADTESKVHGLAESELSLHAAGDDDTLLDVVGVAAALAALDIGGLLVSPIPLQSGGSVVTGIRDHPDVPLPAPATLELLRGFSTRAEPRDRDEGSDEQGETVTPTGAAILATMGTPAETFPAMRIEGIGYGAGARDPAGRANVVRIVLGTAVREAVGGTGEQPVDGLRLERDGDHGGEPMDRPLVVLEANLDDLTPELVADAAQALLVAGALDVWTTPVHMKKGRPGVVLSALCEPHLQLGLRDVFFEATSTLGVRAHAVRRAELNRRTVALSIGEGTVRVKLGLLRGRTVSATPEHDDVAGLAARTGRPVRDVYEEAAAAARSLRFETADE